MGTEWVENDELSQVEEGNDKAKILTRDGGGRSITL